MKQKPVGIFVAKNAGSNIRHLTASTHQNHPPRRTRCATYPGFTQFCR